MNATKAYLKQYLVACETIRRCEADIAELENTIETITLDNDGMPRSSNISDRTSQLGTALADATAKREALIVEAWDIREDIEDIIAQVTEINAKHGRLLYLRYIQGADWRDIADDEIIRHDAIYTRGNLHVSALKTAENVINSTGRSIIE